MIRAYIYSTIAKAFDMSLVNQFDAEQIKTLRGLANGMSWTILNIATIGEVELVIKSELDGNITINRGYVESATRRYDEGFDQYVGNIANYDKMYAAYWAGIPIEVMYANDFLKAGPNDEVFIDREIVRLYLDMHEMECRALQAKANEALMQYNSFRVFGRTEAIQRLSAVGASTEYINMF